MIARVLLVDDDPSAQITLAALLEDSGFEVATASSAEETDDVLAAASPFQVALVDYHLDGTIGTDLVPAIRAHSPDASVLLVTGDAPGATPPGVAGWITKGGDAESTIAIVRRHAEAVIARGT